MSKFFLTNVRYEKMLENGLAKKVTESYIVDALSFTEAEARTIEEMSPYISGEYQVTAAKIAKYSEVVPAEDTQKSSVFENAELWYKICINYLTLDEKTGNEKKTKVGFLLQAADLRDAIARFDGYLKATMTDYEIVSVSETSIMDVFFYQAKEEK